MTDKQTDYARLARLGRLSAKAHKLFVQAWDSGSSYRVQYELYDRFQGARIRLENKLRAS
jgi:hypothetical protein